MYFICVFRIERFWQELWQGFTVLYYNLFYALEEQNILDISNEIHMKLLHLVFQPRMQIHLNEFCDGIRRRPLRTEHNRTPMQLWLSGQPHSTSFEQEVTNKIRHSCYGNSLLVAYEMSVC